jgi:hypothetical protein
MLGKNVSYRQIRLLLTLCGLGIIATAMALLATSRAFGGKAGYKIGANTELSASCGGQNAEVHQAVDPKLGYVYEAWTGCGGIGFARSTDGGHGYSRAISLPGSVHAGADDPAVAVAPDGTVYASFMLHGPDRSYPVVAASFDHGATFAQVAALTPPRAKNWGDADFIAVGPRGTVYVTWDYGPNRSSIKYLCSKSGSCSFANGDLNVVIQKSSNRGKTFGPMSYLSPGFPAGGADSAPLVVEPSGRIDVLYQGYQITNASTDKLGPAYSYFTSSLDQGSTWSRPVRVGQQAGTMSPTEWWIDGDISLDSADNLYATWDTQGRTPAGAATDTGWLAFSIDHGRRWSAPIQVPTNRLDVPHITEVTGAGAGIAYISWHSDNDQRGYAQYLRAFSTKHGWISAPTQLSSAFGNRGVWPGDTFGISSWPPDHLVVSWGSATPPASKKSEIFAATVTVSLP